MTTKRVSLAYNPVYWCDGISATIKESAKPVFDTTYEPYMSDGKGKDNDKEPKFYQTTDGQKVLKKVAAFYSQVPMPCVVAEPAELLPSTKKPKYHIISNVMNDFSILVLKTWESNPGSQKKPCYGQDRQEPAQLPFGPNPGLSEISCPNQEERKPAKCQDWRSKINIGNPRIEP
ncbi:hypothetical protein DSO57_1022239 [Entomophthora muscae]|uniref:Uncharacterized protein n=1 Tax=Entomophthora muscae TaxID=34485 RepID=A0ACC2TDZ7_9FUNG|nr:hypothetical protein DSO57_1022239 [Entomophthora muscae]